MGENSIPGAVETCESPGVPLVGMDRFGTDWYISLRNAETYWEGGAK